MSDLFTDLETYADEAWTKKDIKAGLRIIGEVAGVATIAGLGFTAVTVWVPGIQAIGIPITASAVGRLVVQLGARYADLPTEDRACVRKTISFLRRMVTIV